MGMHQASAVIISCVQKGKIAMTLFLVGSSQFYYSNYIKGFLKQSPVIQLGHKGFKDSPYHQTHVE